MSLKTAPWIIIIVLIVLLVLQRECKRCPEVVPCPEIDTTYLTDTVTYLDTVYIPKHFIKYDTIEKTIFIPTDIDSMAIVKAYFDTYYVIDTIINDTNVFLVIRDKIGQNEIQERAILDLIIFPHNKFITKTEIEPYKPKNKVFLGVGIGRSLDEFGLSANVMLLNKKDNAYQLSYDVLNQDIYFTMFWKLKFRKDK